MSNPYTPPRMPQRAAPSGGCAWLGWSFIAAGLILLALYWLVSR